LAVSPTSCGRVEKSIHRRDLFWGVESVGIFDTAQKGKAVLRGKNYLVCRGRKTTQKSRIRTFSERVRKKGDLQGGSKPEWRTTRFEEKRAKKSLGGPTGRCSQLGKSQGNHIPLIQKKALTAKGPPKKGGLVHPCRL